MLMFDDQPINNNNQIPNNLPVGEPEDMFAGVEKESSAPNFDQSLEIGSDVSQPASALDAGILKPKNSIEQDLGIADTPAFSGNGYNNINNQHKIFSDTRKYVKEINTSKNRPEV